MIQSIFIWKGQYLCWQEWIYIGYRQDQLNYELDIKMLRGTNYAAVWHVGRQSAQLPTWWTYGC